MEADRSPLTRERAAGMEVSWVCPWELAAEQTVRLAVLQTEAVQVEFVSSEVAKNSSSSNSPTPHHVPYPGCFTCIFLKLKVAITKAKVDFSGVVCLPPSVIAGNGLDGGGAGENDDEPVLVSLSAAPSPQSEAVANELQELSLQPELTLSLHHGRNPNLPPLSERKNGLKSSETFWGFSCRFWFVSDPDFSSYSPFPQPHVVIVG
ncbi:hypothetical protein WISP_21244 [Willisornis vidua]|uniref:Uncharacterized protein n=1 Tax=Willisornis vidua TaxID=1566151 RepID=A0ABQ9DP37_9PASS|nr:hypothetical protein WISP_21244 [Willisornis vidua]